MADALDAVVVGSGPNGLTAAVTLAERGLAVRLYEASDHLGGGARTAELTLPGFHHDICSAVHPFAAGSPAFTRMPLAEHGLEWLHPEIPLAHPQTDGTAAVLIRSLDETVDGLGERDGRIWRVLMGPLVGRWDELAPDMLQPVTAALPRHPLLLARFGVRAVWPPLLVAGLLRTERARTLLAGIAAHAIAPLSDPLAMSVALSLGLAGHDIGWPLARGGSQAITDALASYLRQLGGEIVTGTLVGSLDELPPARAYLLDVMPEALAALAGERLPEAYRKRLVRYRHGPAVFKLDYALSEPVPWTAEACRRAGTVHVGASLDEIGAALRNVTRGRRPDPPFLIASQPTLVDPDRAPEGRHILWVYGHVPHGWDGDLTDAIEDQIERFAPGFRDVVLARSVRRPADLEADNPNLVGGDVSGGAFRGTQTLFRPLIARVPYATPDPSVFLCSSATPPGPGVHGMGGWQAANLALHRVFARQPAGR
jgi:phytoene dehydrogenase-like protein